MPYNTRSAYRISKITFALLLVCKVSFSQAHWGNVDKWMQDNLEAMGGRSVLMIYKDGKMIYDHAENGMDRKQKRVTKFIARRQGNDAHEAIADFTSTTRERIASCSKWLSAALVMTFVDEGKLDLEDSIGKYLPVMTQNGKGNIKIRYCLSHLTGIKQPGLRESISEMNNMKTMNESMALIAAMPMEGLPGKTFHYSNSGLQICAAIVEKIGGKNFEALFEERIAKPCMMTNTDYGHAPVALAAGGGWSTPQDYMNFLEMILHKGIFNGKRVLSEKSIAEMELNRTREANIAYSPVKSTDWYYGYGEWVITSADKHTTGVSSPGLFGSFPWVELEKNYCGFLFVLNLKTGGREKMYDSMLAEVSKALQ